MILKLSIKAFALLYCWFFFSVCSSTTGYAQPVHVGVRAGLGISYIKTNGIRTRHLFRAGTEYVYPNLSFNAGVFVNISIIRGLSIQGEGNWQFTGFRHEYADFGVQQRMFTFSNIAIPAMLKYSKWGVGILGGIQYNRLLSAKRTESDNMYSHTYTYDIMQDSGPNEWGLVAGLEYTFRFGLGFNFRYYYGISNMAKGRTYTYHTRNAVYNRNIQFWGIHYRFVGNKKKK